MADYTHTTTIILDVNDDKAQRKIKERTADLEAMRKRLNEIAQKPVSSRTTAEKKEYTRLTREIQKTEKELNRMQSAAAAADRVLGNISTANLKELRTTLRNINRELESGSIERGSDRWNALSQKAREIKQEINKVNTELSASKKNGLSNFGEKWSGLTVVFDSIISKIGALKSTMEGYVNEYAEMAEHMSGVKKYTGLTDDAVRSLNDDFRAMDTRTPRQQLNDLAADAGRLGIQSKQQVLDFVQAADQINVALGEDLGEDAVKNIGKLAQMFGDADRMGLKQAMLSTASIINDLAQSSSASEGYLMDFTARLAGVGNQAGMSQSQIMAFASVLDQNMVEAEKGATALQNVITALYANPAKMARIAGLDVQNFTHLLKTNGNEALLQFATALQKAGSMDALAPMLKEMKLSGAGVTQTLSTLAANIDVIRATQAQAATAFQQGTSVTNEFNQANNTAQAQLEKAQKRAADLRAELGERLYPAYTAVINGTNTFTALLMRAIAFVGTHTKQFVTLAAVITTYTLAVHLATIGTALLTAGQKALNFVIGLGRSLIAFTRIAVLALSLAYYTLTGNLVKARAAHIALQLVMKANSFALMATAVVAVAGAIYLWVTREKQLTEAQRQRLKIQEDQAAIEKKGNEAIATTQAKIYQLTAIIHDNNRKLSDRYAAIRALKRLVPGYNAQISQTGQVTRENTRAINNYISALKKKAMMEAAQEQIKDLMAAKLNQEERRTRMQNAVSIRKKRVDDFNAKHPTVAREYDIFMSAARQGDTNAAATIALTPLLRDYGKLLDALREAQGWETKVGGEITSIDTRINALTATFKRLGGSLEEILNIGVVTTNIPTTTEGDGGGNNLPTPTGGGKGSGGKNGHVTDHTPQIRTIDEEQAKANANLTARYAAREIATYYDYQQLKLKSDKDFLLKKRALYKEGDTEIANIDRDIADIDKQLTSARRDYSLNQIDVETEARTRALNIRHEKETMDEEQYQRELSAIQLEGLDRRSKYLHDPANRATAEQIHEADLALEKAKNQAKYDEDLRFAQKVANARKEWLAKSAAEQQAEELKFAKYLNENGLLSEEEYQKAKAAIAEKYAKKGGKNSKDTDSDDTDQYKLKNPLGSSTDAMSQEVEQLAAALGSLKLKLKDGKAAWQDYAAVGVAALSTVSAMLSSVSQLYQAQQQEEEARVTARYDAEIKAAGSNSARAKKLEEQKQKETAAIKNKYNRKMQAVELAQAVAQTAMNAIMAYGSVVRIPIVGPILAVAAAAAAVAAGAIQIAAIKKQHAAQAAGYYEGGFTGGTAYHREAGVVHQGEFVANHQAVRNPALLPLLQLIDHAQRTNRVASLTPADVSRAIAAPMATSIATTQTANSPALQITTEDTNQQTQTLNRLSDQIDQGITAIVTIDGPQGLDRQYRHYKQLNGQA